MPWKRTLLTELNVQTQAAAAVGSETAENVDAAARLLLPPGFSTEGPTEAVAIPACTAALGRTGWPRITMTCSRDGKAGRVYSVSMPLPGFILPR